jgi:dTDP-glucose 4,6-dehydratase
MTSTKHTVLITGGAGFIGSHVVEHLVQHGHRVVNLDLLTYAGNLDNLTSVADHERYSFAHGDICDRRLVARLLAEHRPTIVFNIAAESHVDRSIDDGSAFIETNVTGVFRMLEASLVYWRGLDDKRKAAFRFIQLSTDEVYGSIAEGAFTEESNYAPNSPYAASKAAGDHMARAYAATYGLPVIVVHASNTYGPRQYPEKLIPHMIISALQARPLPVYGQGLNVRDWMYVGDLARGLASVVTHGEPGEVYNFAGCDECRNIDTVRQLCRHLDRLAAAARPYESSITFVTDRPGHDFRYAMAIDKVRRALGWEPRMQFSEGLPSVIAWYLDNKAWWQSILERGYGGARIGLRSIR